MSYEKERQILDGTVPLDENLPYGILQQIQVCIDNGSFILVEINYELIFTGDSRR